MAKKSKKSGSDNGANKRNSASKGKEDEKEESDIIKRALKRRNEIKASKRRHTPLVAQPKINLHYTPDYSNDKDAKVKRWFNTGCLRCYMYPCTGSPLLGKYQGKTKSFQDDYYVETYKVAGRGSENPKILFIGEAPGYQEDKVGKVFVGSSGKILRDALIDAGIVKSQQCTWFIDNVVCCRPKENKTPSFTDMIPCSAFLAQRIASLKPEILVPLGGSPLKILLNDKDARIGTYVGNATSIELSMGSFTLFPLWHPAYVLRNMNVYDDYVFYLKRLRKLAEGDPDVAEVFKIHISKSRKSLDKAEKIVERILRSTKVTAFDIETASKGNIEDDALNPFSKTSVIVSIAFSYGVDKAITLYTYHPGIPQDVLERNRILAKKILLSGIGKIAHNAKFDMLFIKEKWGFDVNNLIEDTMLTHYTVISEDHGTHGLKALATRYADLSDYSEYVRDEDVFQRNLVFEISKKKFGEYNAMDVIATRRISKEFHKRAKEYPACLSSSVAYGLLPRATVALTRMEHNGMFIDLKIARTIKNIFKRTRRIVKAKIELDPTIIKFKSKLEKLKKKGIIGKTVKKFSLRSHPQLRVLLFNKRFLNLPVLALTKKTQLPSTNSKVMTTLSVRHGCDLCGLILDYRGVDKTYGTYLKPFYKKASVCGGYIHGKFLAFVARTGRLSSSNPNLQNIPNKSSGHVKRLVVSRYGDDGLILSIDYSQIELRVMASLSGDERMLAAYREGKDLHRLTTLSIYGISDEEYSSYDDDKQGLMRTVAKRVNFGVIYGITSKGIVNILEDEKIVIEEEEAEMYIERFFQAYPGVTEFIENVRSRMYESGVSVSAFGRLRRFAEALVSSYLRKIVGYESKELIGNLNKAERQAVNHVIQSTASDVLLSSLTVFDDWLNNQDVEKARTFAVIHDAIDVDVKREHAVGVIKKLVHIMENVPEYADLIFPKDLRIDWDFFYRVPIKVDVDVGVNWRDMVKFKTEITAKNLSKLLAESHKQQEQKDNELFEGNFYAG